MQNLWQKVNPEWHSILLNALKCMDSSYLNWLLTNTHWLPGATSLFAAFGLPLSKTRYVLLGESPYPRAISANGYAFWDGAVGSLWSDTGLSKDVNRATSLRNIIKMLLYARGDLKLDFSQAAIAKLDKSGYPQTAEQLFQAFMDKGILLLNASLVYEPCEVQRHAKQWLPFLSTMLAELPKDIVLILFGRVAQAISPVDRFCLRAEHPYNISFIINPDVVAFFKPLDLLRYEQPNNH